MSAQKTLYCLVTLSLSVALLIAYRLPLLAASRGTSGGSSFRLTVGARPFGMGEAFVGLAEDVYALHYNVAGLVNIPKQEVGLMYQRGVADLNHGFVAYVRPLSLGRVCHMGFSVEVLDAGTIDVNPFEYTSRTGRRRAKQDFIFNLAFAKELPPNYSFGYNLSVGAGIKALRSTIAEESSATSYAGQIGLLLKLLEDRLRFGFALKNFGGSIKYSGGIATGEQSDPLPLAIHFGSAYKLIGIENHKLITAVEMSKVQNSNFHGNLGLEYWFKNMFALRAGYKAGYDTDSVTTGVGFRIADFQLDYGFGLMEKLDNSHKVSLIFRFGPITEKRSAIAEKHYQKGLTYFDRADFAKAIFQFNRTIQINPNHANARKKLYESIDQAIQRGLKSFEEGDYVDAIMQFNLVFEMKPEYKKTLLKLKEANEKMKER